MALVVQPVTAEEEAELRRRAASRTLPARVVERAKMIRLLRERSGAARHPRSWPRSGI
jgi:hypothetical protein